MNTAPERGPRRRRQRAPEEVGGSGQLLLLRPSRLMEPIAEQLRALIISGVLAPGSPLPQQELAERLAVSRTPLREALLALEQEGLVESAAGGATRVVQLTQRSVLQALRARGVLDGMVARLAAAQGLEPEQAARLRRLLGEMRSALREHRPESYQLACTDFHLSLLGTVRNRWLDQFSTLVRISAQATFQRLRHHPLHLRRSVTDLEAMLRAIQLGDADAAERAARSHMERVLDHWETGHESTDEEAPDPAFARSGSAPAAGSRFTGQGGDLL